MNIAARYLCSFDQITLSILFQRRLWFTSPTWCELSWLNLERWIWVQTLFRLTRFWFYWIFAFVFTQGWNFLFWFLWFCYRFWFWNRFWFWVAWRWNSYSPLFAIFLFEYNHFFTVFKLFTDSSQLWFHSIFLRDQTLKFMLQWFLISEYLFQIDIDSIFLFNLFNVLYNWRLF